MREGEFVFTKIAFVSYYKKEREKVERALHK